MDPAQRVVTDRLRAAARRSRGTSPLPARRLRPPQLVRQRSSRGLPRFAFIVVRRRQMYKQHISEEDRTKRMRNDPDNRQQAPVR